MLDKRDAADVLDAYNLVLKSSQRVAGELGKELDNPVSTPDELLDSFCEHIRDTFEKMTMVKEQCEALKAIPTSVSKRVGDQYRADELKEQRHFMEKQRTN